MHHADVRTERFNDAEDRFRPGVFAAAVSFAGVAGAILALLA